MVAVFDGMPMQNHRLLRGRVIVDDPDDYATGYESKYRIHGIQPFHGGGEEDGVAPKLVEDHVLDLLSIRPQQLLIDFISASPDFIYSCAFPSQTFVP